MKKKTLLLVLGIMLISACYVGPAPTPCPTCAPTSVPTATVEPQDVLWDERLTELGLFWEDLSDERNLEAAWITVNGDWGTAPQWAKDKYPWANLGGDHNAYGMYYNADGSINPEAGFVLQWPYPVFEDGNQTTAVQSSHPYWANFPLYAGYDWQKAIGPYTWEVYSGDRLVGLGLPYPPLPWEAVRDVHAMGGVHVSYFGVWREARW